MKKKIILIVIIILACSLVGYGFYKSEDIDENNENINKTNLSGDVILTENDEEDDTKSIEFTEEKIAGSFKFTNIKFNYIGAEEYEFVANVENVGNENLEATNIDIKAIGANGEEISIFGGITTPLMPSEKGVFKTYVLTDVSMVKDVEFLCQNFFISNILTTKE